MDRTNHQQLNWRLFAALSLAVCLLLLAFHPAPAHSASLAAFVLLPVLLFGLVLVPISLWPAFDLDQHFVALPVCRANLFERPPPSGKN